MNHGATLDPQQTLAMLLGLDPFPWQKRLLRDLLAGRLPRALDLPTGLGKTSVMAIWLAARAAGGSLPRRLVYVVDRRAVVDQATREAESLREHCVGPIASALGLPRPLPISTLRGQFVDNREWLEDPATPAIVVGTVDMIGSRLLFEGYACSRKMRPYHAGLLGSDTLFVVDEAHLVPPFERLLEQVTATTALRSGDETVPNARLLSLSATGRDHGTATFRLDDDDLKDAIVKERIHAEKTLFFERLGPKAKLAETLADRAWALASASQAPLRVLVFCNLREDAEKALLALEKRTKPAKPACELFIGARRVKERLDAERTLRRLGFLAGSERPSEHAFLFATSAAEVGVDLDADHMVADVVAWERMVQRLGRVNRRGKGTAQVQLVGDPESPWCDFVETLIQALPSAGGGHDGSPAALGALRKPEHASVLAAATTPDPLHPPLTRPLLDAWSMTSLVSHTGRPEVQPWLRGWVEVEPQTSVVWRCHLPEVPDRALDAFFEAAAPHTSEQLDVETHRVVSWLTARASRWAQLGGGPQGHVAVVLDPSGSVKERLELAEIVDLDTADGRKRLHARLAGQQLVVTASLAGLAPEGTLRVDHDAAPPTGDVGDPAWSPVHGDPTVRFRVREQTADEPRDPEESWRERLRLPLQRSETGDEQVSRWLVVEKWHHDGANEDDRSSGPPQALVEHQAWTSDEADQIARSLGLPDEYRRALVIAARLHDEGKRSARWQRAFSAPLGDVYAKTRGPIHLGVLGGYRHEFGSLPIAARDPELRTLPEPLQDLVLHLIAAHHGSARPVIRTDGCDDAPPSAQEQRARDIALRFVRLQAKWGPWGLAWWETLLRAADQRASRRNDPSRTR